MLVASGKGRSGCGWGLIGFLFGPLGLLAAAIASPDGEVKAKQVERAGLQGGALIKCPACAEIIKREATKCKHCGTEITPPDAQP